MKQNQDNVHAGAQKSPEDHTQCQAQRWLKTRIKGCTIDSMALLAILASTYVDWKFRDDKMETIINNASPGSSLDESNLEKQKDSSPL